MNPFSVNACVREDSRTLQLTRHLLSRLSPEVTKINPEEASSP